MAGNNDRAFCHTCMESSKQTMVIPRETRIGRPVRHSSRIDIKILRTQRVSLLFCTILLLPVQPRTATTSATFPLTVLVSVLALQRRLGCVVQLSRVFIKVITETLRSTPVRLEIISCHGLNAVMVNSRSGLPRGVVISCCF